MSVSSNSLLHSVQATPSEVYKKKDGLNAIYLYIISVRNPLAGHAYLRI